MKSVAVLIPCYNEEATVCDVVLAFRKSVPQATIYVYDNCSDDNTAQIAKDAGAVVVTVSQRGKGNVVRKMFADVDADIVLMVDGDSTYAAEDAPKMVDLIASSSVDMVVAVRKEKSKDAFSSGHKFGNSLFNFIFQTFFHSTFSDIFSGYRAFSRRFVKTFPAKTNGFDVEAELSAYALMLSIPCAEISSKYQQRPHNSYSKLNALKDGWKILLTIVKMLKETRPMLFFGIISVISCSLSRIMSYPIVVDSLGNGLVNRHTTAILAIGSVIMAFSSLIRGMMLYEVSNTKTKMKKLNYLRFDNKRQKA
jgi:glycosyltransferase involved in cell wall biosynthesis